MLLVLLSVLVFYFLPFTSATLLGEIPSGLPQFQVHDFRSVPWKEGLPLAFILAFIAFAEAMTIAKAVDEKSGFTKTRANQELKALGLSNIIGSFFQAFPVNASFSRTAINIKEGAKTGIANFIGAIVVMLCLLFLTSYFAYLPKAILGSIILVAVYSLFDIRAAKKLYKEQREEFYLLLITFLATIFIGVSEGIIMGILFSLLQLVYRTSRPHIAILGKIKGMPISKTWIDLVWI